MPVVCTTAARIARLYKIKEEIRGLSADERHAARWQRSAPIVKPFGVWINMQRSRVSARSRLIGMASLSSGMAWY